MKVIINVTANDIKYGKPRMTTSCPIARAVKRRTIGNFYSVGADTCWINEDIIFLPSEARDFIVKFDRGREVKPFKFTLDVRKELLKGKK